MPKTYTIILYGAYSAFEQSLTALNLKYSARDVLYSFWGKEYTIQKPTGKGAVARIKLLEQLLEKPTMQITGI